MFKLLPEETIRRRIEIPLPFNHGEKQEIAEVFVTWKIQPKSIKRQRDEEMSRLARQAKEYISGTADDLEISLKDKEHEVIAQDMVNLEGIVDPETGEDIPFSDDVLDMVLEKDYARIALLEDWKLIQNNKAFREAEKAKN